MAWAVLRLPSGPAVVRSRPSGAAQGKDVAARPPANRRAGDAEAQPLSPPSPGPDGRLVPPPDPPGVVGPGPGRRGSEGVRVGHAEAALSRANGQGSVAPSVNPARAPSG